MGNDVLNVKSVSSVVTAEIMIFLLPALLTVKSLSLKLFLNSSPKYNVSTPSSFSNGDGNPSFPVLRLILPFS